MKNFCRIFFCCCFLYGCVASKKYKAAQSEYGNLQARYMQLEAELNSIRFNKPHLYNYNQIDDFDISMQWSNLDLKTNNLLPIIPLPPPQPTAYLVLRNKDLSRFNKYSQVDSLISSAFHLTEYSEIYLAVENGGFAVATNFEEINSDGSKKITQNKENTSILALFSKRVHGLFFSNTGYFRCIIIIASPNIYSLGGQKLSQDQIQAWLRTGSIRLPEEIAATPLTNKIQLVALLYEFEQNDNIDAKVQILDATKVKTDLTSHPLVKLLNNGN